MKTITLHTDYTVCSYEELSEDDRRLIDAARRASQDSYAPYSHFRVGAAIALENGQIICGNNQENVAYPSGICAERCAMFHANALYPQTAPTTLAIAARNERGVFTETPVTPCGACRQVLLETEHRYGRPLRVLLYGERHIFCIDSVVQLLPLQFEM